MWSLIKNEQPGGFFSRAALLVKGEPVDVMADRADSITGVLTVTDRPGTAAGLVVFAYSPHFNWPLMVTHYELAEVEEALTVEWLEQQFVKMRALSTKGAWNTRYPPQLWVENDDAFGQAVADIAERHAIARGMQGHLLNVALIESKDTLPPTVDERAHLVRTAINGGSTVKLARSAYLQQSTFRSSTTNHLTSQIFGYKPGTMRDSAQELVNSLATAIEITRVK